jgi:hypothetical protein
MQGSLKINGYLIKITKDCFKIGGNPLKNFIEFFGSLVKLSLQYTAKQFQSRLFPESCNLRFAYSIRCASPISRPGVNDRLN